MKPPKASIGHKSHFAERRAIHRKTNATQSVVTTTRHPVNYTREIVLRGSIHQGHATFGHISRGRQCTANAALAIAMTHTIPLNRWTRDTIDDVLFRGDRLYIDSIMERNVPNETEMNREYLRVTELSRRLEFPQMKVDLLINEQTCIDGNLIQDFEGFPNLRNGLGSFFREHPSGILTTKGISLAIFQAHGYFWLFDSHARGRTGRQCSDDNAACLVRFDSIERLYDMLECNLSLVCTNTSPTDQYTITPIYVVYISGGSDVTNLTRSNSPIRPQKLTQNEVVLKISIARDGNKSEPEQKKSNNKSEPEQKKSNKKQMLTAVEKSYGSVIDSPRKRKQPGKKNERAKRQNIKVLSAELSNLQKNSCVADVGCGLEKGACSISSLHSIETPEDLIKNESEFHAAIWQFVNNTCISCNKLFYKSQMVTWVVNDLARSVLPPELKDTADLFVCRRCKDTLKKGKCPTQAYWNAMFLDHIPEVIADLTDIEKRLICMVVPFIKIIKLGGRFGQYGFKGQAILFAQDIGEVVEQLPLSVTSAGIAIVCERLENVTRTRQFQVDVEKLWSALIWLKEHNPLYRNVHIDYSNVNFDLSQICQVLNDGAEIINAPEKVRQTPVLDGIKEIKGGRGIVRGSLHQNSEHFYEGNRGYQCTAMAATSIIMSHIQTMLSWSTHTIDIILINGDRLHGESVGEQNVQLINCIKTNYLAITDLNRSVELLGNVCNLIIDDVESIHGHLSRDDYKAGFRKLSIGLENFFTNNSNGILIANGLSVAIFKAPDQFWMFDSNSRGFNGRIATKCGVACLMRFPTVESLFKMLKCNIPKSGSPKMGGQYSITPIRVIIQLPIRINTPQLETNIPLEAQSIGDDPVVMTSILRPIDECIPQVDSVVCGYQIDNGDSTTNVPLRTLQRKTAPPLQMHVERRAEELAWFYLFPMGRNGLHEPTRRFEITPLDYCQARVMSTSNRFQRNDSLFYALSAMEFYRARTNVGVCLRLRQGDTTPGGLVQNVHLQMRSVRGSNAYWHTACSDLIAMVRNLGPPTWFVTLSCNDLNWNDMLTACLIAAGRDTENPDDLTWDDKLKLIEQNPVTLSRQFMVRLHAIMRILKRDDKILGGKLVDYWWRIEFQNRGSPHLHMLCWNDGVPPFETVEGIAVIDKVVSCASQLQNKELAEIVQRVQIHRHSQTCYKKRSDGQCRFGFPRQCSDSTKILDADETIRNKGRFCILQREFGDTSVNNYNPALLMLWRGNMDIQPCGSVITVAYYIAKYTSKGEPLDVGQAVKEAIQRVQRYGGDTGKQLYAVSMAILRHRQVSAPECAFRLCHLKLRDSTRTVVFVNTCRREERYRMLRCYADGIGVHMNIFDRYIARPQILEELSLAEFAVRYEHVSNIAIEDDGDNEVYGDADEPLATSKYIRLQNGIRMKQRSRDAILKTRHYTQAGDREGYFYSYLVAHIPFRNEEELLAGHKNAEDAFNAKRNLLRPLRPGRNVEQFQYVERELQQVIAQVLAMKETEPHNHGNVNLHSEVNDRVEAVVEGYEPILEDIDIQNDVCDNREEHVISVQELVACVRSLNVEQKELYDKINNAIREDVRSNGQPINTLKLFVTGGAGCGETFLLKLIVNQIKVCYAPTVDSLLRTTFVEVCALTGVAARLVHGRTLHYAFSLGIEKGKASAYRQLTGQRLEDLRQKWKYIRWLIIDEISMVSYEIFRSVHLRLQELKNNNLLFGGVHVIVFGDIMQLPPVKGSWCFIQPANYIAEPHLWRFFGLCELRANMRQQNDAPFVDLLNNLRVGKMTVEQYEILMSRTRVLEVDEFADGEAVRIFPTLKLVDSYNNRIMQTLASRVKIYIINAHDESREPRTHGQLPPVVAVPTDPNNTGGFLSSIKLAIGCRVMLRNNIRVSEGLVNGALGVVRGFQWPALRREQLEVGELPRKVFIQFDDPSVGTSFKEATGLVGISPVSVTYQGNKGFGNVERLMLPLILSWAVTVHKLQGTTVDRAVVYLGKKLFAKGQAYVALSRVRSIAGLAICQLDRKKLFNHPHDGKALEELERLRNLDENG